MNAFRLQEPPMPLRIVVRSGEAGCVMELHGWLRSAELEVFERTCASHGLPLQIDLRQLMGADAASLKALHRQRAHGAEIVGASPYIALLMSRADTDDERSAEKEPMTTKP